MNSRVGAFLAALAFCGAAFAQPQNAQDLDERAKSIESELRCLVCQNQTIADSNADLAADLRNTIREQLARGATDKEVIKFMTARYGDFVLYRPPLKAKTVLLWFGPFLFLLLGAWILYRRLKQQRPDELPVSEEERARAARLLDQVKE